MSLKGVHLLAGKTAAITGGTTGSSSSIPHPPLPQTNPLPRSTVGRAITLLYLRQGCNVAVNHLDLPSDIPHLESLHAEARSLLREDPDAGSLIDVPGDVSKPETGKQLVESAVHKWGRLDVFVSNAGVCRFAEFLA